MGTRHKGRKLAIQALYQASSRSQNINDFLDLFIEKNEKDPQTI